MITFKYNKHKYGKLIIDRKTKTYSICLSHVVGPADVRFISYANRTCNTLGATYMSDVA